MNNKVNSKVKRRVSPTKLKKLIKRHNQNSDVVKKLIFIQFLYNRCTVVEASELMDIDKSTGYRWLDQWNEEDIKGYILSIRIVGENLN
jgi:hypothetical protein